jgi:hypothetical protein
LHLEVGGFGAKHHAFIIYYFNNMVIIIFYGYIHSHHVDDPKSPYTADNVADPMNCLPVKPSIVRFALRHFKDVFGLSF